MNICPKCGLPKEACMCETLAKSKQKIRVYEDKKRYGKIVTIVEGIDERDVDIKKVAKELKSGLACGGTTKDNKIELQGSHLKKVQEKLTEMGFSAEIVD